MFKVPMSHCAHRAGRLILSARSRVPTTTLAVCGALIMPLSPASAQEGEPEEAPDVSEQIQSSREALAKWVDTVDQISKERADWQLSRQLLLERIDVVKDEIDKVQEQIDESNTKIEGLDEKLVTLRARNEELKASAKTLEDAIAGMEARTLAILAKVPAPLREEVEPLAQQIPGYQGKAAAAQANANAQPAETEPAATADASADASEAASEAGAEEAEGNDDEAKEKKLPLALRFQNVLGVLNRFNGFNGKIHDNYEDIKQADGTEISSTTLFFGLGRGYYVGADGAVAGVGYPGESGWVWEPNDEIGPDVQRAIAVLKNEQPAVFIGLPIEVK